MATDVKNRLAPIDGLRACAAMYVVWYHMRGLSMIPIDKIQLTPIWFFTFGHFAVVFFIAISGYCLGLPLAKNALHFPRGVRDYLARRAIRILPTFYLALLATLALLLVIPDGRQHPIIWLMMNYGWKAVAANALLLQDVWERSSINSPFWSITVEWRLYFTLPVMATIWRRYGLPAMLIVVAVVGTALAFLTVNTPLFTETFHFMPVFLLGVLAAHVTHGASPRLAALRRSPLWAVVLLVLTSAFFLLFWHTRLLLKTPAHAEWLIGIDYLVGGIACCLFVIVNGKNPLATLLGSRPFTFVGEFSYSIYLMHMPASFLVWQYVIYPYHLKTYQAFYAYLLVGTPLVVVLCYLFYLLAERPVVRYLARQSETIRELISSPTLPDQALDGHLLMR